MSLKKMKPKANGGLIGLRVILKKKENSFTKNGKTRKLHTEKQNGRRKLQKVIWKHFALSDIR